MKQTMPPGVVAAILVVVVLIVGFFAYRTFIGANPNVSNISPQQLKAMQDNKRAAMTERRDSLGRPIPGTGGMSGRQQPP